MCNAKIIKKSITNCFSLAIKSSGRFFQESLLINEINIFVDNDLLEYNNSLLDDIKEYNYIDLLIEKVLKSTSEISCVHEILRHKLHSASTEKVVAYVRFLEVIYEFAVKLKIKYINDTNTSAVIQSGYINTKEIIKHINNKSTAITINNNNFNKDEIINIIQEIGLVDVDGVVSIIHDILNDISTDKLISPDKRVFIPAIQQLSYSMDSEILKSMYTKLIKSSMHKDEMEFVHPSYVSILSQLCADEAKIIYMFPPCGSSFFPILDVYTYDFDLEINIFSNFSDIGFDVGCEYPHYIEKYLDNLIRLNIIRIVDVFNDKSDWDNLIDHVLIKEHCANVYGDSKTYNFYGLAEDGTPIDGVGKILYRKKYFTITTFGASFIRSCNDWAQFNFVVED